MTQEKSRAVLMTPERAVRSSVLAILRVTPSKRFCMMASDAPSICNREGMVTVSFMAAPSCTASNDKMAFRPSLRTCARIDDDRSEVGDYERRSSDDQ